MKTIVNVKELQTIIKNVNKVKKSDVLNSENIIIKAKNGQTSVIKDNGYTKITQKINSSIKEEGIIGLDENTIKILSKLPNNDIEFTNNKINSGTKEIKYINKEYIKEIDLKDCIEKFQISQEEMLRLLEVSYCASVDEVRPILQGINFKDNKLCALDGYRMSVRSTEKFKLSSNFTIHQDSVKILKSLLKKSNELIYGEVYKNYVLFKFNDTTIQCRYLEGDYIKYEQLINDNIDYMTTIKVNDIKEINKSLDILKDVKINNRSIIYFSNNEKRLSLRSNNNTNEITDTMNNSEYIKFNSNGDTDICFNCRYLVDLFKVLKDRNYIYMSFKNNHSPMIIYEDDNLNDLELILPIRMNK